MDIWYDITLSRFEYIDDLINFASDKVVFYPFYMIQDILESMYRLIESTKQCTETLKLNLFPQS